MGSPRDLLPRWLVDHHLDDTKTTVPSSLTLQPWNDGFIPSGCDHRPGKIIANQPRSTRNVVRIVDAAVHATTADLIYASAMRAKVWGVYVLTQELHLSHRATPQELATRRVALEQAHEATMDRETQIEYRTALGRLAVEEFLVAQGNDVITCDDWRRTHGIAVWVIASDCDDETEYHLDYAEMLRFETNVIFPPIYGATLHVSPLANDVQVMKSHVQRVEGGGFHVNIRGLDHYREYGYKTRCASKILSTDEVEAMSMQEPEWRHVPYQYRRGIICDGDFPHFSGRVRALPSPHKRVVVGFNLFPHVIGAFVQKYPEHSDAFNRHVKLAQTAAKQPEQVWNLESLKKNPKQAAFLKYLARKVRETQEQQRAPSPTHDIPTIQLFIPPKSDMEIADDEL